MNKMTAFQERVYAATTQIPQGKVVSYGMLAKMVGVASAQAVGQALKKNPNAPEVPCHRIIRRDGFIGGYFGTETEQKRTLLAEEGVFFNESGFLITAEAWWEEGLEHFN